MTSTLTPPRSVHEEPPRAARRLGHTIAALLNGVLLWVTWQLLDWEWPSFLTADFADVRAALSVSFAAGMAANVAFLVEDRGPFRHLADLVTSVIGVVVSVRMWDVFPFDFASGYDWSWLARTVLLVGIVGSGIGAVVALGKLVGDGLSPRRHHDVPAQLR